MSEEGKHEKREGNKTWREGKTRGGRGRLRFDKKYYRRAGKRRGVIGGKGR